VKPLPKTQFQYISIGCDPEFFFRSGNGPIIGAEKIIPEQGLLYKPGEYKGIHRDGDFTVTSNTQSKFIIDGVQAELNPRPNTCRANLANEIACCFKKLEDTLKNQQEAISLDFSSTVAITPEELNSLKEESRKFGCTPSMNTHLADSTITVNPSEYMFRSAGGHIHLGHRDNPAIKKALSEPNRTVPLLDMILGNTCVLLDRDPGNIERRKNYGRAGEYRLPTHGLEYRTLSNFWLLSYPLMSLVTGLARHAVLVAAHEPFDYYKEFTDAVKLPDVVQAIQENDFDLAMSNFKRIEHLLLATANINDHYPINQGNIDKFYYFVSKGINHWFKEPPLTHWANLKEAHAGGFSDYLNSTVYYEM
jgi:hypothetical protein